MDPKPRRGRLRRWAALLAALVRRGGAWVRRAAAEMRRRLARRAALLVKREGGRLVEARNGANSGRESRSEERAALVVSTATRGDGEARNAASSPVPKEDCDAATTRIRDNLVAGNPSAAQEDPDKQQAPRLPLARLDAEVDALEDVERPGVGKDAIATPSAVPVSHGWHTGAEGDQTSDLSVAPVPEKLDPQQERAGQAARADGAASDGPPREKRAGPATSTRIRDNLVAGNPSAAQEDLDKQQAPRLPLARLDAVIDAIERRGEAKDATATLGAVAVAQASRSDGERAHTGDGSVAPCPKKKDPREGPEPRRTVLDATVDLRDEERAGHAAPGAMGTELVRLQDAAPRGEATPGGTRGAAGSSGGGERAETGDRSVAPEPHPGALPNGSNAVLVQPDVAASSSAGASGEAREPHQDPFEEGLFLDTFFRGALPQDLDAPPPDSSGAPRRRKFRVRKNKKPRAAHPRQDQPPDEEQEDDAIEDVENKLSHEMKIHETYRDKAAVCRKTHIFCLICHMNNKEKELLKDENEIKHHCKAAQQCNKGRILCDWKGCFVRAKYNRDIGLHQYVCHKLS